MNKSLKGVILIAIASIFWGLASTFVKITLQTRGDPLIIAQTRVSISAIILIIFFLIYDNTKLKIEYKDFVKFLFIGIFGLAGSNYFYYSAIKETTVANAILIQYIAPILVAVYSVIFVKEKISRKVLISIALSTIGIFFAIDGFQLNLSTQHQKGIIFAFAAAFSFATFTISAKNILKKYNNVTAMIYTFIATSLFWIIVNPPQNIIEANYSLNDWGVFIFIAIISILIPYSCYFYGLNLLSGTKAILAATLEPIVAIISEIIFLGTSFTNLKIFGAVLVILSIVNLSRNNIKNAYRK
ncbi:MAG: DMT family transporter [Bacteroidetes bacterium]|nr:DMT family transporter [Bacteroidota bacterium]